MKKIPFLAIVLFLFTASFSQTQTEKEVKDLLMHKWKLTHFEMNGQKSPVPAEIGDSFLDIKADGLLIEIDPSKETKAKWSYDHKTKTFTTDDEDGVKKHELIKISDTELILKADLEGMLINLILKRV